MKREIIGNLGWGDTNSSLDRAEVRVKEASYLSETLVYSLKVHQRALEFSVKAILEKLGVDSPEHYTVHSLANSYLLKAAAEIEAETPDPRQAR